MKHSVKLLLREDKPNEHNQYPIWIRITIEQRSSYIATGYFIDANFWDEKTQAVKAGHLQAAILNADITTRKTAIMQKIVELDLKGQLTGAGQIKELFAKNIDLHNVFDFIAEHKKSVKHKREQGTLVNYDKYERKLELYVGSRNLHFEQVDQAWLQKFEDTLRGEGLDNNYVHANLVALRTMFNAARKKQIITSYPYDHYEMPIYEQKEKDYLSLAELQELQKFADTTKDPTYKQTAIYFILGCLTGLRISDWFRFDLKKHVHQGSVRLRAKKNGEWVTMPIMPPLKTNLARMAATPLTITEHEINRSLKDIAKKIKAKKYLTTHSGRHTFAVTICADQGIGLEVCSELMGITVATCQEAYYRVTKTKIDQECKEKWAALK